MAYSKLGKSVATIYTETSEEDQPCGIISCGALSNWIVAVRGGTQLRSCDRHIGAVIDLLR